ncbi:MAG: hypothetical protein J7K04_16620 [Spirochaetales bacterium]|nr:hypothetical protein [Spirochaetales bacterium]
MTPKKRVLTALHHSEPDRVPFMYRDIPEVRKRLLKELKLKTDDELFEYLGIDFRWIKPKYIGPQLENEETGHIKDIWGVEYKYTKFNEVSGYWNEINHPLKDVTDPKALDDWQWPKLAWWDFSDLKADALKYSNYAIMTYPNYCSPGILQSPIQPLIGIERSFTDMYIYPDFYEALIRKILEFQIPFIDKLLSSADDLIDFFRIGDDFGSQEGLLISIDMFDRFFKPAFKAMVDVAKEHHAYYYQHSCGSVADLIPSLLDIGLDVLDPIQVKAAGMEPAKLKEKYGDILCFSGGVDEQELLPKGTPEEVHDGVLQLLNIMAPEGGFFIGSTHNFQVDIPTENIIAMYKAAAEWEY